MTPDPNETPTAEEQAPKSEAVSDLDFELPTERQEGTNCTDDICTVCQ